MTLFETGIRPAIDAYLKQKSEEQRDYGQYWSASSAGYCMRLNIMKRLGVPPVPEIEEDQARTTRVFESGHIFHEWIQRITKEAGLSIASEVELQDEDLMIRGHFDDLVLIKKYFTDSGEEAVFGDTEAKPTQHLILYDYKTANSQAFNYKKDEIGQYHKMQLGTYMYMLRNAGTYRTPKFPEYDGKTFKYDDYDMAALTEARILTIEKDTLRMREHDLHWTPALKRDIENYWTELNKYWEEKKLPPCTCLEHDGGFMGRRSKKGKVYNPFFYNDEPCSLDWYKLKKEEGLIK